MTKLDFYTGRVQAVRVRAQRGIPQVELDVEGSTAPLTPTATRALIRRLQHALAFAEGRK